MVGIHLFLVSERCVLRVLRCFLLIERRLPPRGPKLILPNALVIFAACAAYTVEALRDAPGPRE